MCFVRFPHLHKDRDPIHVQDGVEKGGSFSRAREFFVELTILLFPSFSRGEVGFDTFHSSNRLDTHRCTEALFRPEKVDPHAGIFLVRGQVESRTRTTCKKRVYDCRDRARSDEVHFPLLSVHLHVLHVPHGEDRFKLGRVDVAQELCELVLNHGSQCCSGRPILVTFFCELIVESLVDGRVDQSAIWVGSCPSMKDAICVELEEVPVERDGSGTSQETAIQRCHRLAQKSPHGAECMFTQPDAAFILKNDFSMREQESTKHGLLQKGDGILAVSLIFVNPWKVSLLFVMISGVCHTIIN